MEETNKSNEKVFHLISNTHWDREWRFPFQRNRQMLVEMIDSVLKILKNDPDYRAFHLDSQSIVLKDYLEVRPYNRQLIIDLTKEGRLLHGPWYILPDEFQVGGECLVRNLLMGHRLSRELGGVSKLGYSPFSWGQISQLPQIYAQFGIKLIMFYRGVNSIDSPGAEFLWEGADGTQMISSRFSTMPRYNFYFYLYRPVMHNESMFDLKYDSDKGKTTFHFADRFQYDEDHFVISEPQGYYPQHIPEQLQKIVADQAHDFLSGHVIWMEGHDSSGPHPYTPMILRDIRKLFPEMDVRHSSLEEYAESLAQSLDPDKLPLVRGERRSSQNDARCGNLFGYTLSARMYIKQAHFRAERSLQYYAEPFQVFAGWLGQDISDRYAAMAWELLVENSAHDSIGGCSLDRIHEDMMQRYRHAEEISSGLFARSLSFLCRQLNTRVFGEDGRALFLVAVNPLNQAHAGVVEAFVDVPAEIDLGALDFVSAEGKSLSHQLNNRSFIQPIVEEMTNRPLYMDAWRYHLWLETPAVPSYGLSCIKVIPRRQVLLPEAESDTSPFVENAFLRIHFCSDGTMDILDKQNKHEYKGMGWFQMLGEGGHAWVNQPLGKAVDSRMYPPEIKIITKAELMQQIQLSYQIPLPEDRLAWTEENPRAQVNAVRVKISLAKNSPFFVMNIELDNRCESHRMRMMFPGGLNAPFSYGEGQFDVVARAAERPDTSAWIEQPMYDYPMHHFVDVHNQKLGFAIFSEGLREYELCTDSMQTLAITLLRSFEYRINPAAPQDYSHEKGSQMLGNQHFRLGFYPHAGSWEAAGVFQQAQVFAYELRLVQTSRLSGPRGSELSMLMIEPDDLIISALKKSEDTTNDYILRLYNPTQSHLRGYVKTLLPLESVSLCTLEELNTGSCPLAEADRFEIEAAPKKMLSYRLRFVH